MSGSNAKISVITVCYQAVKTIAATIQSVLEQTDADMEYVIVDGGSTDGTLDRIRAVSDSRIQLISERDQGIYDAMNKGVRLCSGEYVIFINAGDLFADREVLHTAGQAMGRGKPDSLYGE